MEVEVYVQGRQRARLEWRRCGGAAGTDGSGPPRAAGSAVHRGVGAGVWGAQAAARGAPRLCAKCGRYQVNPVGVLLLAQWAPGLAMGLLSEVTLTGTPNTTPCRFGGIPRVCRRAATPADADASVTAADASPASASWARAVAMPRGNCRAQGRQLRAVAGPRSGAAAAAGAPPRPPGSASAARRARPLPGSANRERRSMGASPARGALWRVRSHAPRPPTPPMLFCRRLCRCLEVHSQSISPSVLTACCAGAVSRPDTSWPPMLEEWPPPSFRLPSQF